MAGVTRLVLDTNIWLDWLVFDEPALAPLRAAQAAGRVEIVMDVACEAELARVLAYDLGKHTIGAEAQARCMSKCRSIARRIDATVSAATATMTTAATAVAAATSTTAATATAAAAATGAATAIAAVAGASGSASARAAAGLPRCADPDDQKFLELALAARADALVTKDRALLDLGRRGLPFRIAAPQALGAL